MYTIQLLSQEGKGISLGRLALALQRAIARDERFRVGTMRQELSTLTRRERAEAGVSLWQVPTIYLQCIRLTAKKPYCGNHPGPCYVGPLGERQKPNSTLLEWDDWVAFHTLVNEVCDHLNLSANIWTLPRDVRGKMWIRKGLSSRLRWDYEEQWEPRRSQPLRVWNTGTPDQFQKTRATISLKGML